MLTSNIAFRKSINLLNYQFYNAGMYISRVKYKMHSEALEMPTELFVRTSAFIWRIRYGNFSFSCDLDNITSTN